MEFTTLEHLQSEQILQVINQSFADYIVPMQLTAEKLASKIISEQIDLSISVGAFENNQLVGFMLHGTKPSENTFKAYNAITGVLPKYRGNKLAVKMYDFLIPILKEKKYTSIQLEAITSNTPALKSYIETGFTITRILECYKGKNRRMEDIDPSIEIISDWQLDSFDWIWDWEPTWQNDALSINNAKDEITCFVYKVEGKVIGYLMYNNLTKRVHQFAVAREYRDQRIATKLFNALSQHDDSEVEIINLQAEVSGAKFLNRNGFKLFVKQYEMTLPLV